MTRFAYLDDAGVDHQAPRFVVAGVIANPDRQSAIIEERLFELASEIRPDKPNVVLHACDLWHGSGDFPKGDYSQDRRRSIVRRVAALPHEFGLPVVAGQFLKSKMPDKRSNSLEERQVREAWPHVCAQFDCANRIELWMRANLPDEVAQLVHEDIPRSKKLLKWFHNIQRDKNVQIWPSTAQAAPLPYTKIKGPIFYADKREERMLQVADTCAFIFARHLNGKSDVSAVFDLLSPQVVELRETLQSA